jgi:hypothetical protein
LLDVFGSCNLGLFNDFAFNLGLLFFLDLFRGGGGHGHSHALAGLHSGLELGVHLGLLFFDLGGILLFEVDSQFVIDKRDNHTVVERD